MSNPKEKNLPLAIGLNLLFPGAGYVYMGRVLLGIMAFLLVVATLAVSIVTFGITWLVVQIIMALDMVILFNKNAKALEAATMMKCPQCAEMIKREAKVCRFCGVSLDRR